MKKFRFAAVTAAVLACAMFAGCGRTAETSSTAYMEADAVENDGVDSKSALAGFEGANTQLFTNNVEYGSAETDGGTVSTGTDDEATLSERVQKLVYSCSIEMQSTTFDATLEAIKKLISDNGGFIEREEQYDNAHDWYYSGYAKKNATLEEELTVRIPSEKYETFLQSLEGEGKILSKVQNVENITTSYYDTATTIEALKTQEKRLLEMMEAAETIEDMIAVEERLSEVQTELARYENSLASMDADVEYSTVSISLSEVMEYTEDPAENEDTFGSRFVSTLKASWKNALGFLEGALFAVIMALPIILICGAAAAIIIFIIVRMVKRRRKKGNKAAGGSASAGAEGKADGAAEEDAKADGGARNGSGDSGEAGE